MTLIEVFAYIIVAVLGAILLAILFVLSVFIYGRMPKLRARKLTAGDVAAILNGGIIHKTTEEGACGICNSRIVKGHRGIGAYSNRFMKSAFFFVYDYMEEKHEQYNDALKYSRIIKISNITEEQLKKMRIRKYDKALIVCGDFKILEENCVDIIELEETKISKWKRVIKSAICANISEAGLYQVISAFITLAIMGGILLGVYRSIL